MLTTVAISLLLRFMAFYVTEHPLSSSRSMEALHHPPFLAVFSAILKDSPSQITTAQQRLTTCAAYGLSARFYSISCFSLIGLEFRHICYALRMKVPE